MMSTFRALKTFRQNNEPSRQEFLNFHINFWQNYCQSFDSSFMESSSPSEILVKALLLTLKSDIFITFLKIVDT